MNNAIDNIEARYRDLRDKAAKASDLVMAAVCRAVADNPDALRAAIGSVAFRRAEEYKSYEEQADAAIEEWIAL